MTARGFGAGQRRSDDGRVTDCRPEACAIPQIDDAPSWCAAFPFVVDRAAGRAQSSSRCRENPLK
jgi:hypothetical protein